jgi:very-short-patch-repair endonuclease
MNGNGRVSTARRLRRSQTDAERVLWFKLRDRRLNGLKFRRQVSIDRYVVDFFCVEANLIIEVDGGQHATADETQRTKMLEAMGYLVLRFWNNEVHENIHGVLDTVLKVLDGSGPLTPTLSPPGRGSAPSSWFRQCQFRHHHAASRFASARRPSRWQMANTRSARFMV